MALELKIFTLNCWGIPIISKNRIARMQAIAEVLATSHYDLVCLQEVWTDHDFNLFKEKLSGVLPYSHYFYSGVVGSGVCILSKHQIDDTFFHPWPLNGYIHKLQHGDWFGGKGMGLCRLKINNFSINLYLAHLHAEYNPDCDEYRAHRVLQAFDAAQFILLTSAGADLVVLAGDLNTQPGDLAYRVILSLPGLTDSYGEAENIPQDKRTTCETLKNSYTPSSLVKRKCEGQRLDYIMYHAGSNVQVHLKKYEQPLPDRVPNKNFSYSDHEAVSATLEITKVKCTQRTINDDTTKSLLEECLVICDDSLKSVCDSKIIYWMLSFILFVLLIITLALPPLFNIPVLYFILKAALILFMAYTLAMGTLWVRIERNALLSGKTAMENTLKVLSGRENVNSNASVP